MQRRPPGSQLFPYTTLFRSELFEDQLAAADLVVISKADELGPGDFERLRELISTLSPKGVKIIAAEQGRLPFEVVRSEEHTSELQSQSNLVCRLLLEKKKIL